MCQIQRWILIFETCQNLVYHEVRQGGQTQGSDFKIENSFCQGINSTNQNVNNLVLVLSLIPRLFYFWKYVLVWTNMEILWLNFLETIGYYHLFGSSPAIPFLLSQIKKCYPKMMIRLAISKLKFIFWIGTGKTNQEFCIQNI